MWHPLSLAEIYDLSRALRQPRVLDAIPREDPWTQATGVTEISGACFVGQDVVISTSADEPDTDEADPLGPCTLARWSARRRQFTWNRRLAPDRRGPTAYREQHPGALPVPATVRRRDRGIASRVARPGHRAGRQLDRLGQGVLRTRPGSCRRARTTVRGHQQRDDHRHPARLTTCCRSLRAAQERSPRCGAGAAGFGVAVGAPRRVGGGRDGKAPWSAFGERGVEVVLSAGEAAVDAHRDVGKLFPLRPLAIRPLARLSAGQQADSGDVGEVVSGAGGVLVPFPPLPDQPRLLVPDASSLHSP
jgi:hypothetical protein